MHTCGSTFQAGSESRYHSWISNLSWVSHSDLEGTARDVAAVKTHVYRVDAVLSGDEADGVLICRNTVTSFTETMRTALRTGRTHSRALWRSGLTAVQLGDAALLCGS